MKRIYGLDTWRSALLLVGPIIHSTSPGIVSDASSLFRMPAFFLIAGFISAHSESKQCDWLSRRVRQLVLPLLCTWVFVLIPIKLIFDRREFDDITNPDHLWFVISLIASTLFTRHISKTTFFTKICNYDKAEKIILPFVILAFILSMSLYPLDHLSSNKLLVILLQTPAYALYYVLGYILQKNEFLFARVQGLDIAVLSLSLFVLTLTAMQILYNPLHTDHQNNIMKMVFSGLRGVTGVTFSFFVLSSAVRITWRWRIVQILSKSSFTVYLFHLPIIMIITYTLSHALDKNILFLLNCVGSFVASLFIHRFIISRHEILRRMFNGVYSH